MIYNTLYDQSKYNLSNDNIDLEYGLNQKQPSHLTQLLLNMRLFEYIKQVYFYTGIGWSIVLISAELMSLSINSNNINLLYWIYLSIGFVLTIIGMIFSSAPTDTITLEDGRKKEIIPWWKNVSYLLFSFSLGLMISPVIFVVNNQNKIIFPICIVVTNIIFGIISIFAWTRKNMDGLELYGPLMTCVSGLIIIGLMEIVLACLGFDKFVCLLSFGTSIISVIIFSGLIYVDTLKAIESYNKSELNAIKCAIEIVLDLVNILLDLIRILLYIFANSDN